MNTTVNRMMVIGLFVNQYGQRWLPMVNDGECLSSTLEPKEIKAINQVRVRQVLVT